MIPLFAPYKDDTGLLRTNENYDVYIWMHADCKILFSITRQGKGAVCHFTSDKAGLRLIKQALKEWCEFVFWLYEWCEMIIGIIERPSVCRLAEYCGFKLVSKYKNQSIYVREKQWVE